MNRTDIRKSFATAVKSRREKRKITQEGLAERANLHRTYISDIERGVRNLSLENINKLAHALEVPISELFQETASAPGGGLTCGCAGPRGSFVDILLVEDNNDDVELTLLAFEKARFLNRIEVVGDGGQALDFLFLRGKYQGRQPGDHPQIILLDLNLPGVGGLEVLRQIRADKKLRQIPVIVLTSSQSDQDMAECRRLGVKQYMSKPVNFQRLSQVTPFLDLHWALLKTPEGCVDQLPVAAGA